MSKDLNLKDDPAFFLLDVILHDVRLQGEMNVKIKTIFDKTDKNGENIAKDVYKEKYNMYFISNDKKGYVFNPKIKEPVHKLTIFGNYMKEIKSIPKGVLSLWFQGLPKEVKANKNVVPKTVVSMFFRWTDYFLGNDLRSFKNLKVLGVPDNHTVFSVPKLPKSIEYIDFSGCQIGMFDQNGLDNFKLADYPNLKYANFSKNYIKKIPQEWKDAKKKKKLVILYDKQIK